METQLNRFSLADVQKFLKCIEHKWYDIGVQLGLDPAELESIKISYHSPMECLRCMIQLWLKGLEPIPSWENLCRALEGEVIAEPAVARTIRQSKGQKQMQGYEISFAALNIAAIVL